MDNQSTDKKQKAASKPSAYAALRVKKETRRRVLQTLQQVNKKDFGRKVRADQVIALGQSLLRPEHLQSLQESSLSHSDRLERDYRAYVTKHGAISKDEYLGRRLSGEIAAQASPSDPTNEAKNSG